MFSLAFTGGGFLSLFPVEGWSIAGTPYDGAMLLIEMRV